MRDFFIVVNSLGTQWNMGFSGATGLNYSSVALVCDIMGVKLDSELFNEIMLFERKALEVMNCDS
ncbi:TPA: DUF1799 domain-containing protein [Escherichia coli]|nr:DUF1799 domain-containing protein [Escherichia coli]